jgi:hypothetical protein
MGKRTKTTKKKGLERNMKKILSLALALALTLTLAAPVCAADPSFSGTPSDDQSESTSGNRLYYNLFSSSDSTWTSCDFTASLSNGNYIRFWHQNNTGEDVRVYLYRTDSGGERLVSSMTVSAHHQGSKVYYSGTAGSGTYRLVAEAHVSGGSISGSIAAAQCKVNPDRTYTFRALAGQNGEAACVRYVISRQDGEEA